MGDATISIPLLQGAGRHIAMEPLTQAERNVVYAIYAFERYKRTFAVEIAARYLGVLQRRDVIKNSEENYRSLIASAKRERRRADAGRQTEIQVDQAVQNELQARENWIKAIEGHKRHLDAFKLSLGLPPDADISLSGTEMSALRKLYGERFPADKVSLASSSSEGEKALDEKAIQLVPPNRENAGPLELDPRKAVAIAQENRLDLRTAYSRVQDAQRNAIIAADRLGLKLSFLGRGSFGEGRSIGTAALENATLNYSRGIFSGLLTLDLPLDQTGERNAYRKSLIDFERDIRSAQALEDQVKLDVRNRLRDLLEAREGLSIQTKAVELAQKRVQNAKLLLEAGRAQIRDLLEAQTALLSTQNSLAAAVVNYRVAELSLQSDMGVLAVNENGLWQEFLPEGG